MSNESKLDVDFFKKIYIDSLISYLDRLQTMKEDDLDMRFVLLCCFVDDVSSQIFPSEKSAKEKLKKLFRLPYYSGEEFLKIDLLYFYKWQKNSYIKNNTGNYWCSLMKHKDLYDAIVHVLKKEFDEEMVRNENSSKRYLMSDEIIRVLYEDSEFSIKYKDDKEKINIYLNRYSNADVFYHLGRCTAVHEGDALLLNRSVGVNGEINFKTNHLITPDLLNKALREIFGTPEFMKNIRL